MPDLTTDRCAFQFLNQYKFEVHAPLYPLKQARMFTGIEFPYILALLYPSLNYVWWFPKISKKTENEIRHVPEEMHGIQIYHYQSVYHPPTYVNVSNVMVPIGGYTSKEKRPLYAKHISPDKKNEYFNYWQIDDNTDINMSFTHKSHINSDAALTHTFNTYNIPLDRFAINLPLEVRYYNYKNGMYLNNVAGVATDKSKLLKEVQWCKRLPWTMTVPITAASGLLTCWLYYGMQSPYAATEYYPPFHPKRIKGYFKK